MPIQFPAGLTSMVQSGFAFQRPTLDLVLTDGTPLHLSTLPFTIGEVTYVPNLDRVGSLRMTLARPADEVDVELNNIDDNLGLTLASARDALNNATGVYSKVYKNIRTDETYQVKRLTGKLITARGALDRIVKAKLISDINAAGNVGGKYAAKRKCDWRYKDPNTCAYSGPLLTCDFSYDGPNGCRTHILPDGRDNTHHWGGGGLFLDATVPSILGGDDDFPGGPTVPGDPRKLCFIEGTHITLADGRITPNQLVQVGTQLRSFDPETGYFEPGTVTHVHKRFVNEYLSIKLFGYKDRIGVTGEHPFYVKESNGTRVYDFFVRARDLRPGDVVFTETGTAVIASVDPVVGRVRVYNFTVSPFQTYIAGDVLVHNLKPYDDPFLIDGPTTWIFNT